MTKQVPTYKVRVAGSRYGRRAYRIEYENRRESVLIACYPKGHANAGWWHAVGKGSALYPTLRDALFALI